MPVRKVCMEFWQPSCLSALTMPRWQPSGLGGASRHLLDSTRVAVSCTDLEKPSFAQEDAPEPPRISALQSWYFSYLEAFQ